MKKPDSLHYITPIENLQSILEKGILPRNQVQKIKHKDIYGSGVLRRGKRKLPNGKMIGDCVNLYFQARNAMLYSLVQKNGEEKLAILQVQATVMEQEGVVFSDRNTAASDVRFFMGVDKLKEVDGKVFGEEYWVDSYDTKQRMMAEVSVPRPIGSDKITSIYVASEPDDKLKKLAGKIKIIPQPSLFFAPAWQKKLTDKISLLQGDMFFSNMQTFTVSVNLQGVMGKGLAARAKYQFPDAYVRYQDDCRRKKLKIGKPTLFKRGIKIEEELADIPHKLKQSKLSGPRWFLFLPTKRHWRENSYFEDIEKSMQWLLKNYKKEGVQSIALPALGCGLGHLSWKNVGPMMCHYLTQMGIRCCVYLPGERMPEEKWLQESHLLYQQRWATPDKSLSNTRAAKPPVTQQQGELSVGVTPSR